MNRWLFILLTSALVFAPVVSAWSDVAEACEMSSMEGMDMDGDCPACDDPCDDGGCETACGFASSSFLPTPTALADVTLGALSRVAMLHSVPRGHPQDRLRPPIFS